VGAPLRWRAALVASQHQIFLSQIKGLGYTDTRAARLDLTQVRALHVPVQ
jgi:hypothetical protein